MKKTHSIILFILLAAIVLAAISRLCVFDVLTILQDDEQPTLMQGDRVLLNRWSYGYRVPYIKTYHRYASRPAGRGEWVAFNHPIVGKGARPDTSRVCIGKVLAAPGDTIWFGNKGNISAFRNYANGCIWPFILPASGTYIHINPTSPWLLPLYSTMINRYEPDSITTRGDKLFLENKPIEYYRFNRNYYWFKSENEDNLSDSRSYGPVPEECLLGKLQTILYSFDPLLPWTDRWRRNRTLIPIQ